MKKIFIILAATLALVGCAKIEKDAPSTIKTNNEISFSTKTDLTKAVVTGTSFNTGDYFSVFADWNNSIDGTTVNFMDNVKYKNNGDVDGSTHYYWPDTDGTNKLDFYAIYPYDENYSRDESTKTVTIAVDCEKTNGDCVDLMLAVKTNQSYTERVALQFKHQLSYVKFVAKKKDIAALTSVTIKSIVVTVPYTKASLPFVNSDNPSFSGQTKTAGYTYTVNAADVTATTSGADCGYFLAIPQDINVSGAFATITYEYVVAGKPYTKTVSNIGLSGTMSGGGTFVKWNKGNMYTYNIEIGIKEILFTPSVSSWTDGGSKDVF